MILGIDPGRDKTGWALTRPAGELVFSGIFPASDFEIFLRILALPESRRDGEISRSRWLIERGVPPEGSVEYVALGNGTGSEACLASAQQAGLKVVFGERTRNDPNCAGPLLAPPSSLFLAKLVASFRKGAAESFGRLGSLGDCVEEHRRFEGFRFVYDIRLDLLSAPYSGAERWKGAINNMASMDKLAVLVNTFGSSLISVGREVGLEVALNKSQVSQGVKVANICAASLIGIVGSGVQGTAIIMLDRGGFGAVITAMSGGMIVPDNKDSVAMSVIGELSNMVSGRALIQSALPGVDVTPPQLLAGDNIQNVPSQSPGIKCFTLPFAVQPEGTLYLVLSFNAS